MTFQRTIIISYLTSVITRKTVTVTYRTSVPMVMVTLWLSWSILFCCFCTTLMVIIWSFAERLTERRLRYCISCVLSVLTVFTSFHPFQSVDYRLLTSPWLRFRDPAIPNRRQMPIKTRANQLKSEKATSRLLKVWAKHTKFIFYFEIPIKFFIRHKFEYCPLDFNP